MLIDSHCHLNCMDLAPFDGDVRKVIAAAKDLDVEYMLCVGIDLEHLDEVLELAEKHPEVYASVGVHPAETEGASPTQETLIQLSKRKKVIAIGETGLDYFHCKGDTNWQRQRFVDHIQVAIEVQKPLIIHTRDAKEDTIAIMRQEHAEKVGGVMHCFTETWDMAEKAMNLGFYISFSGIVTFKNAKALQEVAQKVPMDRILVETDTPYLTPTPYRGKPNQPGYTRYVAEYIAQLKGISYDEVAKATTENFNRLFKTNL